MSNNCNDEEKLSTAIKQGSHSKTTLIEINSEGLIYGFYFNMGSYSGVDKSLGGYFNKFQIKLTIDDEINSFFDFTGTKIPKGNAFRKHGGILLHEKTSYNPYKMDYIMGNYPAYPNNPTVTEYVGENENILLVINSAIPFSKKVKIESECIYSLGNGSSLNEIGVLANLLYKLKGVDYE